jgi:hypothetical protein
MSACCQGYFPDRGTVRVLNGYEPGLFAVKGLQFQGLLINDVNYNPLELIAPKVAIDGSKRIYTFGADFGNVTVNGEVLLGNSCSNQYAVNQILSFYSSNRVSEKQGSINVNIGNSAIKMFLTGMSIGQANAEFNLLSFGLTGLVAEPDTR